MHAARIVLEAEHRDPRLAEVGREALELALCHRRERVIVTLRAVDALTQHAAGHAAGEFLGVEHVVRLRLGHEVHRGRVGPQPPSGHHLRHDAVHGAVVVDRIGEPRGEAIAPEDEKRPLVVSREHPREPPREILGAPPLPEESVDPAIEPIGRTIRFEAVYFLERRDRAREREPCPPQNGEVSGGIRRIDARRRPPRGDGGVERRHQSRAIIRPDGARQGRRGRPHDCDEHDDEGRERERRQQAAADRSTRVHDAGSRGFRGRSRRRRARPPPAHHHYIRTSMTRSGPL